MASTPLDEILAAVRVRLETRKRVAQDRAHAVKLAADAYVAAVERESLSELAGKVDVGIAASTGPTARDAARALATAISDLPELRPSPPSAPAAPLRVSSAGAKQASPKRTWSEELTARRENAAVATQAESEPPKRRAPTKPAKVVVLGGVAKREKLSRIEDARAADIEWIGADKAGKNAIRNLEGRILDGRVAGVVILDGFIGHTQSEPIVRAARQTGTPLAYADKGGIATIEKALLEIEAGLASRKGRS